MKTRDFSVTRVYTLGTFSEVVTWIRVPAEQGTVLLSSSSRKGALRTVTVR